MLGLQGNTSSPKEYRCVACSATFTGLASLLVHQASHASSLPLLNKDKDSVPLLAPQPPCSSTQLGSGVTKKDSSDQQPPTTAVPPAAPSLFICDCGFEFKDFDLMLEHKKTHISSPPRLPPLRTAAPSSKEESSQEGERHQPPPLQPSLKQSVSGPFHSTHPSPDTSSPVPPRVNSPLVNSTLPDAGVDSEEGLGLDIQIVSPEGISPPSPAEQDRRRWSGGDTQADDDDVSVSGDDAPDDTPDDIFAPEEPEEPEENSLDASEEESSPEGTSHSAESDHSPKNKTIMKMLASAYMKRFQPVQKPVVPKTEVIPMEITTAEMMTTSEEMTTSESMATSEEMTTSEMMTTSEEMTTSASKSETQSEAGSTVGQLRRLLTKSSTKTKASAASGVGAANIVPLTKTFCPVVVLETRQKLIDSSNSATQGSYQCGRCRKVFQDSDGLTVHHATHRKEKVKCCKLCKELVISKPSLPDFHVCSHMSDKASLHSLKNRFSFAKKTSFHHQRANHYLNANPRKLFFCPLCKHSYTRRYNLTKHKCLGQPLSHTSPTPLHKSSVPGANGKMNSSATEFKLRPPVFNSVSVGTDISRHTIKREVMGTERVTRAQFPPGLWSNSAKSFSPFYPRSKHVTSVKMEGSVDLGPLEDGDASLYKNEQRGGSADMDLAGCSQPGEREGEWTVPLDDEAEVLIDGVEADNSDVDEAAVLINAGAVAMGHVQKPKPTFNSHPMPFFIKDGVKRYPCNKCHKTYSRGNTLRRHLRLCGLVRPPPIQQAAFGKAHQNPHQPAKPMFDCFVCGKLFNRRDNMLVHRRKCQLKKAMAGRDGVGEHQNFSASKSLSLLGAKRGASAQDQRDEEAKWDTRIMSLPSVLPRRVTCECGSGFTSPQLLLEHLQKHSQESYTCPTCGETLGSWADYEVHLQVHMQPHHPLYRGVQLQRSQPLLLRFQQKAQPPRPQPPRPQPPRPQPPPKQQQPGLKKQFPSAHRPLPNQQRPLSNQQRPPPNQQRPPPNQQALTKGHKPQQRSVCVRCGNTFGTRSALLKHLSLNRCKGSQVGSTTLSKSNPNLPKTTNQCPRCNSDFPNAISLKFHQRSGACKQQAFKPMRCPVCVRWFGTVEGLQKHLLSHNQSNSFSCLICQRIYPTMRSLKDHRRKVHKLRAGDMAEVEHVLI